MAFYTYYSSSALSAKKLTHMIQSFSWWRGKIAELIHPGWLPAIPTAGYTDKCKTRLIIGDLYYVWHGKFFVAWVSSYNSYHMNIKCNHVASTKLIIFSFWWSNLKMTLTICTCFPYHVNINLFVIWSISDNWHLIITMYS